MIEVLIDSNESSLWLVAVRRPTLIDMSQVYRQSNQENLEQAFSVAERELGVTRLLDPEGERRHTGLLDIFIITLLQLHTLHIQ